MTLAQLRYLLAIEDAHLNISLAASRLNTTQPGISRQLRLLEEELGFEVFIRRGKSLVQTTSSGTALLERARLILGEVRNIESIAANHRRDTRGTLRIATTQTLGRFVLPPAIERLRASFVDVQVRLRPGGELECLDLLNRDEIDLALVSTEGDRPACSIAIPLFRWRRIAVSTTSHPLAQQSTPVTLQDLASYPVIAAETVTDINYKVGRVFHREGLTPNIACTARDADTIKTFVRHELGIGLMAEMALTPEDSDLVDLQASTLFPSCITWAIMRSDRVQREYIYELLNKIEPTMNNEKIAHLAQNPGIHAPSDCVKYWNTIK